MRGNICNHSGDIYSMIKICMSLAWDMNNVQGTRIGHIKLAFCNKISGEEKVHFTTAIWHIGCPQVWTYWNTKRERERERERERTDWGRKFYSLMRVNVREIQRLLHSLRLSSIDKVQLLLSNLRESHYKAVRSLSSLTSSAHVLITTRTQADQLHETGSPPANGQTQCAKTYDRSKRIRIQFVEGYFGVSRWPDYVGGVGKRIWRQYRGLNLFRKSQVSEWMEMVKTGCKRSKR